GQHRLPGGEGVHTGTFAEHDLQLFDLLTHRVTGIPDSLRRQPRHHRDAHTAHAGQAPDTRVTHRFDVRTIRGQQSTHSGRTMIAIPRWLIHRCTLTGKGY